MSPSVAGVLDPVGNRLARAVPVAAMAMLALAIPAFWPRYLASIGAADPYTHVHAVLGLAWLLLLVVQPGLVRSGRAALHRGLGRLGATLGVAFVVESVLLTHSRAAALGAAELERFGHFLYLPLVMALLFGAALALALRHRRNPPLHARYMACTLLPLLDPVSSRLLGNYAPPLPAEFLYQLPAFVLAAAAMLGLLWTLPAGRPGRGTFAAFAGIGCAFLAAFFLLPGNGAWLALVRGFRELPLT